MKNETGYVTINNFRVDLHAKMKSLSQKTKIQISALYEEAVLRYLKTKKEKKA